MRWFLVEVIQLGSRQVLAIDRNSITGRGGAARARPIAAAVAALQSALGYHRRRDVFVRTGIYRSFFRPTGGGLRGRQLAAGAFIGDQGSLVKQRLGDRDRGTRRGCLVRILRSKSGE